MGQGKARGWFSGVYVVSICHDIGQ